MDGSPMVIAERVDRRHKVVTVLNEARIMVLGTQVLVGFLFSAFFHPGLERLPALSRGLLAASLGAMLLTAALVMTPAPFHRLVERGRDTARLQHLTGRLIALALLPFALSIGIDLFAISQRLLGTGGAAVLGGAMTVLAAGLWYGAGLARRTRFADSLPLEREAMNDETTSVKDRIEHMLTEIRVVLPGAQALLGFQFTAMLTDKFETLDPLRQRIHLGSLCAIALAVILLMAAAPFHRLSAGGEATEDVDRFGVIVMLAAMVPLALGMVGDFFIVLDLVSRSAPLSAGAAGLLLALILSLWFGLPLAVRAKRKG